MALHNLRKHGIADIAEPHGQGLETFYFDFFSLDIEGSEFEALQSLDFSKVGFGIILVLFWHLKSRPDRSKWNFQGCLEHVFLTCALQRPPWDLVHGELH